MANLTEPITRSSGHPENALQIGFVVAAGVTLYSGALVGCNASGEAILAVAATKAVGVAVESAVAGETVVVRSQYLAEFVGMAVTPAASAINSTLVAVTDNPADVIVGAAGAVDRIGQLMAFTTDGILVWLDPARG